MNGSPVSLTPRMRTPSSTALFTIPQTSNAEAQAMVMQNEFQAELNAIDVEYYRQWRDEEFQIMVKEAEQNLHYQEQMATQRIQTSRILSYVWAGMGFLLGIGFANFLLQKAQNLRVSTQRVQSQQDPWKDPVYRNLYIQLSRQREQVMRKNASTITAGNEIPSSLSRDQSVSWADLLFQPIDENTCEHVNSRKE